MSRVEEYRMLRQDLIEFFERLKTEHSIDLIDRRIDLNRAFREREQRFVFMLVATLWYGLERYPHRRHLVWIDDALDWIKDTYPVEFPEGPQIDTEMASDPDPNIQAFMTRVREWMIQNRHLRLMTGGGGRRKWTERKMKRKTKRNH